MNTSSIRYPRQYGVYRSRFLVPALFTCCSLLFLGGCGYHLRGFQGGGAAAPLPLTFIQGDQSVPLYGELRQALRATGTLVVAEQSQAELTVRIHSATRRRRVLSVSLGGKVQEYELIYTVVFDVIDRHGAILLDRQTVRRIRDFKFQETAVNAIESESEQLYRDMRRDVVRDMLRRLQSLAADKKG